jgi:hypothetical protein
MCLLIVLTDAGAAHPIVVASNRDEQRARAASPPGLFVGEHCRMLSPRDRRWGGTWLAVNDRGMFAGLTNIAGSAPAHGAPSRGHLPHLALDNEDLDAAEDTVRGALRAQHYRPFQLALADGRSARVLRWHGDELTTHPVDGPLVLSNEHAPGELTLDLAAAMRPGLDAEQRLDALAPLLLDEGGGARHRILKKGGDYGTVSSSLLAVPRDDPRALLWRYAAGPPDEAAYREYGNLGKRLVGR